MILETSVDRFGERKVHFVSDRYHNAGVHPIGKRATHPIARRPGRPALLLLLAGGDPASSSRLAGQPDHGTLGRVQLRFLG